MPIAMLSGRLAVVTGAADGIGRAIVETFAAEGASVLAVDIAGERLHEAFEQRDGVTCMTQDIAAPEAADRIAAAAIEHMGGVDLLVNNAGTPGPFKTLEEVTAEEWDKVISVNLSAAFSLTKALLPSLKQSRFGRIVNTSSVCGERGISSLSPYCASKMGLIGFTRSLAVELAEYFITANCILPGYVVTGLTRDIFAGLDTEAGKAFARNVLVIPRYGQPEDLANAALFLCSDLGSYVSGQSITVDGGMSMKIPNAAL